MIPRHSFLFPHSGLFRRTNPAHPVVPSFAPRYTISICIPCSSSLPLHFAWSVNFFLYTPRFVYSPTPSLCSPRSPACTCCPNRAWTLSPPLTTTLYPPCSPPLPFYVRLLLFLLSFFSALDFILHLSPSSMFSISFPPPRFSPNIMHHHVLSSQQLQVSKAQLIFCRPLSSPLLFSNLSLPSSFPFPHLSKARSRGCLSCTLPTTCLECFCSFFTCVGGCLAVPSIPAWITHSGFSVFQLSSLAAFPS